MILERGLSFCIRLKNMNACFKNQKLFIRCTLTTYFMEQAKDLLISGFIHYVVIYWNPLKPGVTRLVKFK